MENPYENYELSNQEEKTTTVRETPSVPAVSHFDGRTIQLIGWRLLGVLLSVITLGIAAPWAQCMVYRWEAKHTLVDGKRLYFDGTGLQLLGNYLLWGFLTLITLGIFAIFIPVRMYKWRTSHTHFANPGQVQKSISGGVVFGIIMAAFTVAAMVALLFVMKTYERKPSRPGNKPIDTTESFFFRNDENYKFYIDEYGYYCVVGEDGGIIIFDQEQFQEYFGKYGPIEEISNPEVNNTEPEHEPEEKPNKVETSVAGSWLIHCRITVMSGSWHVYVLHLNSDGTYVLEEHTMIEYSNSMGWYHGVPGESQEGGWYTYQDGILTLHKTKYFGSPYSSEPPSWRDLDTEKVTTLNVSISNDGNTIHFTDMSYFVSDYEEAYGQVRKLPNKLGALDAMEHFYPDGNIK